MRFTLYTLWYTVNIKLHNKTWHEGCQAFYWEVHYNDTAMLVFIGVEERTTVQAPRAMNNGHNKHHHMLLMVAVFFTLQDYLVKLPFFSLFRAAPSAANALPSSVC